MEKKRNLKLALKGDDDCSFLFQCHESRLLARNRVIAREILKEKLDLLYNEKDSVVAKNIAKIRKRKAQYVRKRRQQGEAYAKGSQNIDPGPSDLDKGWKVVYSSRNQGQGLHWGFTE